MSQIFFSHTWNKDILERDTHQRVVEISNYLKTKG